MRVQRGPAIDDGVQAHDVRQLLRQVAQGAHADLLEGVWRVFDAALQPSCEFVACFLVPECDMVIDEANERATSLLFPVSEHGSVPPQFTFFFGEIAIAPEFIKEPRSDVAIQVDRQL